MKTDTKYYRMVSAQERLPRGLEPNDERSIGVNCLIKNGEKTSPGLGYFILEDFQCGVTKYYKGEFVDAYTNEKAKYEVTHWLEEIALPAKGMGADGILKETQKRIGEISDLSSMSKNALISMLNEYACLVTLQKSKKIGNTAEEILQKFIPDGWSEANTKKALQAIEYALSLQHQGAACSGRLGSNDY